MSNWNPDVGIPLAVIGVLILLAIAFFGRPRKPDQGRRLDARTSGKPGERREPRLSDSFGQPADGDDLDASIQTELEMLERTLAGGGGHDDDAPEAPPVRAASSVGKRVETGFDRIVTLFVAARPGETINGADIVVAAEKAGLAFGDMNIFHRLVDNRPEAGPIFSVANMMKPGSFDLRRVHDIETPGLTFFMTLPGPLPALDAWETLLPTAQRMAELLDASVLDEERNTLGRQRIAHLRDELRAFDRKQEKQQQRSW
ncbi:cell division protein ZipA [Chiayiivirga flava]|uniref:Cell division protein ZipA n=1 Tax=Chiayiivirga flava TaxID=659595 RepID=A0A7W8D5L8_9GAMM|nr:cell division protein ZipA [Chiayiivirga flava]MBB5208346.1 cell division protein ZipA [Chiayiivirga flava]